MDRESRLMRRDSTRPLGDRDRLRRELSAPPRRRPAPLPEPGVTSRHTLVEFFDDLFASRDNFLVYDNGYRSWSHSYEEVRGAARTFAARLRQEEIHKGEKILFWGENRPEWIVAFWGCVSEGVIVVPIDYRASANVVGRVQQIVKPRALLVGDEVSLGQDVEIAQFQPGVAMLASRLDVPVVPVRLTGLARVLHRSWRMARPGRATVVFGPPLHLSGSDYVSLANKVEEAVKAL